MCTAAMALGVLLITMGGLWLLTTVSIKFFTWLNSPE